MHKRRNIAWLVALTVGLMLIPVAGASAFNKADKKSEKKQNAAIKKVAKAVVKVTTATAANTIAMRKAI